MTLARFTLPCTYGCGEKFVFGDQIKSVEKVTHIAPSDENNQLIGVPQTQFGVINYKAKKLGLCMGLTDAEYVTTTEGYPDSPQANDDICINAQVASISGALNYIVNK